MVLGSEMIGKKKLFSLYSALTILTFVINLLIYNYSFNKQATPYLHEEKRLDSAILMLTTTLPLYAITSIFIATLFYFLYKYCIKKNSSTSPNS